MWAEKVRYLRVNKLEYGGDNKFELFQRVSVNK